MIEKGIFTAISSVKLRVTRCHSLGIAVDPAWNHVAHQFLGESLELLGNNIIQLVLSSVPLTIV